MQGSKTTEGEDTPDSSPRTDIGTESGTGIRLTRRDALIGAVAAGIAKAFGVSTVSADEEEDLHVTLDEYEDQLHIRRQYANGDLDEFTVGGGTEMAIDYDPMHDDYVVGEVALSINDGDYETFGEAREDNIDNSGGGTVRFNADELWGDSEHVTESGGYDFEGLDSIEADYDNLGVNDPEERLVNDTECKLRFRFVSSHGSITEEEVINFQMSIGVPLGFGQQFGQNFGRNHVEDWPEDWDGNGS